MAQLSCLNLDEDESPDIFSDQETVNSSEATILDESNSMSIGLEEPELTDDSPEWKGISMDEIYKGMGPYGYQQHPPIAHSEFHTVLFLLPVTGRGVPKAYPSHRAEKWNIGYVRMPYSSHSLYPIERANGTREFRLRWEVIQEKMLQSFVSTAQFESAVLSYNNKYAQRWDFCALHHFFTEVVEEEEANHFFTSLLPKIIQLALQLPALVTGPIPLLKQHTNCCISFSQLQVASLLANAFLCTFPRRNSTNPQSEYASYPYINFNRLFSAYKADKPNRSNAVMEKLKCLFHYFRRVTSKAPGGTITLERRYIPKEDCPKWDQLDAKLPSLHITSKGTIETEGAGLLQVDFANKFVGGGVLNWGCVQEEIRFVICPELMVTMLVTEALDDTEALVISGIERYSKYDGYSNNFTWTGDYVDETPRDNSGRKRTSVVAIDALYFKQPNAQFSKENILRELNKAYVGFSSTEIDQENLPAIATGNWGCGAFRGNPKLKVLLQLMAAAVAGRSMVYFTFGDTNLRDSVADMYWHLVQRNIDLAQLFSLLSQYEKAPSSVRSDFYHFLYNRSRMKTLTTYFTATNKDSETEESIRTKENLIKDAKKKNDFYRWPSGSQTTEEEDRIFDMLEKSANNDLMEQVDSNKVEECARDLAKHKNETSIETKKMMENYDKNLTEQEKKKSLWEAMKDRESRRISGIRRTGGLNLIAKNKTIRVMEDKPVENGSQFSEMPKSPQAAVEKTPDKNLRSSSSSSITNSRVIKKSSPGGRRNQPKIVDFFPRKIS
ncbi:poly(ADP-ribose) glycohydrolase-like [Venturia canescens]|uniref:poly(ADP-ribose) glycohydrolase-like n=1 Tax=Venturia canescens TaxID=32260 RepID=UPI001C9D42C4|nr:poly(ADP-ribose) glycohydrolase-like [Venturia canescens]